MMYVHDACARCVLYTMMIGTWTNAFVRVECLHLRCLSLLVVDKHLDECERSVQGVEGRCERSSEGVNARAHGVCRGEVLG